MTVSTAPSLLGRRVQIAGSANPSTDFGLIRYAHELVADLAEKLLLMGAGIVASVGKEPMPPGASPDSPSLTFDWTVLQVVARVIKAGVVLWPSEFGLPIVLVASEKSTTEIPESRRALYDSLLTSGKVRVESIMPGSRAAAFIRQRQAQFGDALVILGGGTGVEHSADLYLVRRKPVVPLDLALGASRSDGTGGTAVIEAGLCGAQPVSPLLSRIRRYRRNRAREYRHPKRRSRSDAYC